MGNEALENVFDIELEEEKSVAAPTPIAPPKKPKAFPFRPTGPAVHKLRKKTGLSLDDFADKAGVSKTSLSKWEKAKGPLKLHAKSLEKLEQLHQEYHRK
jgi:DNA-binding transcriptional regulator YiaG